MSRRYLTALQYLLSACEHAQHACQRTKDMLYKAIARFRMLVAIERAKAI